MQQWWENMANVCGVPKKGLRSLILLVVWEIWKERNRRIFDHKEMATSFLLTKIKEEVGLWVLAGAKCLREFAPHLV
uniref:Reverse transcriptase zinc-binding domain-containing protein n=1 Tax=Oryza glaberrima TaxID=4538 RepID=I1NKM2_ORYGL